MQNEKNASWAWVKHPASPCAITPSEVKALYGTPALRLPKGLAAATIAACTVVEVVVILGQSARVSLQILLGSSHVMRLQSVNVQQMAAQGRH